ncbi:MAG TPA: LCP family protein [Nocardioidaceae bacterium]|nr:LCP family protein [Nocardioidaceae bacterium]
MGALALPTTEDCMGYAGKHRDVKPKRHVVRTIALSTAVVLLVLATGGYAVYRHLEGNITAFDMDGVLTNRPDEVDKPGKPLNILLLGSDTRVGQSQIGGDTGSGLSDTTILLHLSADRKRAYGVSIPRDLMVTRPECPDEDGGTIPGGLAMWNAAYSYGGPVCTVAQFEAMTDIRVNHTVVVDFTGFKSMVDALGGVNICVPREIDDEIGRIHLPAGTYEVSGSQALDYVRVRHEISNNGDIGRMKRQQTFLAAMANKAISAGTLLNPVKLYKFLNAVTQSVSTDSKLSKLSKLVSLANEFKGIGLSKIQFLTMPITSYAPDPNRLAAGEGADELWRAIKLDKPLTKALREGVTKASDPTPGDQTPTETPTGGTTSTRAQEAAEEAERNGLCA